MSSDDSALEASPPKHSDPQRNDMKRDSSLNCGGAPEPGERKVTALLRKQLRHASQVHTCTLACARESLASRLLLCFCDICHQLLSLKQQRGRFQRQPLNGVHLNASRPPPSSRVARQQAPPAIKCTQPQVCVGFQPGWPHAGITSQNVASTHVSPNNLCGKRR